MGKKWIEPRISPEKIKEMAVEYVERRAWLDRDIPSNLLSMCFFMLMCASEEMHKDMKEHPPSAIYGHENDQLGRSVNGFPMFTAVVLIYEQDFQIFRDLVKKLAAAKAEILA